jgi:hypothetical protein
MNMKHISKIFFVALATVLPFSGCDTEELHNLNINPQSFEEVDLNFLFTAAELGSAAGGSAGDNRYIDWRTNIGFASYAIQHLANVSGGIAPGDKYTDNPESYAAPWEFIYGDQLKNLAEILRQTGPGGYDEGRKNNLRQASRILRVFNFHRLTDYYGNIPYSDALEGRDLNFFPTYDNQQAIYTDMLKELDEATAALTAFSAANIDDVNFKKADLIYGGKANPSAYWKRFGYTLMLRLAMRVSNVAGAMADQYVTKAFNGGVFTSNDDNIWIAMSDGPSEWTNQNGISRAFSANDGSQPTIMSKTLIDELKGGAGTGDDDPRLTILSAGVSGNPNVQEGMPNGLDQGMLDDYVGDENVDAVATFSRINPVLLNDADPYMLMNYAEAELLLADAIERGVGTVTGTAAEHYEKGVKAAMQMFVPYEPPAPGVPTPLEVTDAQVTAYLAARPYTGSDDERLELIGTQLWVSKFFNWWEAWADWRRTGYPDLEPTNYPGNVTGGTIPRKLRIPTGEIAANGNNYAAGSTKPDLPTTRVWWDVQP